MFCKKLWICGSIILLPVLVNAQITDKKKGTAADQKELAVSLGNLKDPLTTLEDIKKQKNFTLPKGYRMGSTTVYFSGEGFTSVVSFQLTGNSLEPMRRILDKCKAGSVITFDGIMLIDSSNNIRYVDGPTYYFSPRPAIKNANDSLVNELRILAAKDFVAGKAYFSGSNFSNAIVIQLKGPGLIQGSIDRCAPGTIVVFENAIYRNPDRTLSKPVNTTIKLL